MNIENSGLSNNFKQLSIRYDESHEVLWTCFNQKNMIPCFNHELISELTQHQIEIQNTGGVLFDGEKAHHIKYSVAASVTPNVFNLGGHLALIRELAINRHREALLNYATKGIDVLANKLSRFNNSPIINISLVQGLALGGGFEAVLASDIVIAERKSVFGFPEILFNMFPGMGGYSLVARKAGVKLPMK
jgi:DSF synthase